MEIRHSIEDRLLMEALRRGANGSPAQIILALGCLYFVGEFPYSDVYRGFAIVLTAILAYRYVQYKRYKNKLDLLLQNQPWLLYTGIMTGFLWAGINVLALSHYTVGSFQGLIHIFIANGLLAATMYSMGSIPRQQSAYLLVLGLSTTGIMMYKEWDTEYSFVGYALFLFVFYLVTAAQKHSGDLRSIFEYEHMLLDENLRLQEALENVDQARQMLEDHRVKADYSARLAALGEMAGGIAHEINNPLATIALTSSVLKLKINAIGEQGHQLRPHVDVISDTVTRIAKIVQSMRNLGRQSSQDKNEEIILNTVLEETLLVCREKMSKSGIALDCQVPQDLRVIGKHSNLGQVLLNLLMNAYEASLESQEKKISIQTEILNSKLILRVQDFGTGVPIEVQTRLFQPFFTTKPVGKGTGLGLSISRNLIHEMGGELTLERAKDPTIFKIVLNLPRREASIRVA